MAGLAARPMNIHQQLAPPTDIPAEKTSRGSNGINCYRRPAEPGKVAPHCRWQRLRLVFHDHGSSASYTHAFFFVIMLQATIFVSLSAPGTGQIGREKGRK
jgi:hypothetical protein